MFEISAVLMIENKIKDRFPLHWGTKACEPGTTAYGLEFQKDGIWIQFRTVLFVETCKKCKRNIKSSIQATKKQCKNGHVSKTLFSEPVFLSHIDQLQRILDDWEQQLIGFVGERCLRELREQKELETYRKYSREIAEQIYGMQRVKKKLSLRTRTTDRLAIEEIIGRESLENILSEGAKEISKRIDELEESVKQHSGHDDIIVPLHASS